MMGIGAALAGMLMAGLGQPGETPWANVMLIGTFHFDNPNLDQFNIEADDVLADHRQREIADLVDRLAEWQPDLVLVKSLRANQADLDQKFASFRDGTLEPERSEVVQLGFRLAERAGLDRVGGIDVAAAFVSPEQAELDMESDPRLAEIFAGLDQRGTRFVADSNRRLADTTIGQFIRHMNSTELVDLNLEMYHRYLIRGWSG